MKKELDAAFGNVTGLTKLTEAAYWPSSTVDPGVNALGYTTKMLNWDCPASVV